jgi:hypothetical protein
MPTPYGSRGGVALSADEPRVLRGAPAAALQSGPASDPEVREYAGPAVHPGEAVRGGGRPHALLSARLARPRAAVDRGDGPSVTPARAGTAARGGEEDDGTADEPRREPERKPGGTPGREPGRKPPGKPGGTPPRRPVPTPGEVFPPRRRTPPPEEGSRALHV